MTNPDGRMSHEFACESWAIRSSGLMLLLDGLDTPGLLHIAVNKKESHKDGPAHMHACMCGGGWAGRHVRVRVGGQGDVLHPV